MEKLLSERSAFGVLRGTLLQFAAGFSRSHRPDGNAYCVAPAARLVV